MDQLAESLNRWDKKTVADITAIYHRFSDDPDFIDMLIKLLDRADTQTGASWLLKHTLEQKKAAGLNNHQQYRIVDLIPRQDDWQSLVHLLQCFECLSVTEAQKCAVKKCLQAGIQHSNKFVQAWSYHGFFWLAVQFPELQPQVQLLMDKAVEQAPASVRARVRKLLKQGF